MASPTTPKGRVHLRSREWDCIPSPRPLPMARAKGLLSRKGGHVAGLRWAASVWCVCVCAIFYHWTGMGISPPGG